MYKQLLNSLSLLSAEVDTGLLLHHHLFEVCALQVRDQLTGADLCVRHSRVFISRLLHLLKALHDTPEHVKVQIPDETKKDVLWWQTFLRSFNGVEFLSIEPQQDVALDILLQSDSLVMAGDATPTAGSAFYKGEYWARWFPRWLQDPEIPIHAKEFWVLLISMSVWGGTWSGHTVVLFCDNDAVCEVAVRQQPKDEVMVALLREFIFLVCRYKFTPIMRKIGTKENYIADFLSRRPDHDAISSFLVSSGLEPMTPVEIPDAAFAYSAAW